MRGPTRVRRSVFVCLLATLPLEAPILAQAPQPGAAPQPEFPPIAQVTQGFEAKAGFIKLHVNLKKHRILAEIPAPFLQRPFLLATSIAGGALAGWQWDDRMVRFERLDRRIVLVEPEIRYRAPGSTLADVVRRTYRDTVITAIPIIAEDPNGTCLVDFTDLFAGRAALFVGSAGRGMDPSLAKIALAKVFPRNVEIEFDIASGAAGGSGMGASGAGGGVLAHYSLSELPATGYQPRLADDRIGYFLTALKDFSKDPRDDSRFVRFVNRWNLQKADPTLEVSPPKDPIVFYIEKTVPIRYRRYVKEGIQEWNAAFERVGIVNAIDVRQQTDTEFADLDPEDTRYNFFRWITSERSFAMGPSRVHPETGEILDADIIFDDSMIRSWLDVYAKLIEKGPAREFHPSLQRYLEEHPERHPMRRWLPRIARPSARVADPSSLPPDVCPPAPGPDWAATMAGGGFPGDGPALGDAAYLRTGMCDYGDGVCHQVNFGLVALEAMAEPPRPQPPQGPPQGPPKKDPWPEEFIGQVVKEVVMHEVGHTLGLRHNFKASIWLTLDEINAAEKPPEAQTGSVMDYNPINIAAPGKPQGFWNTRTLGPYDFWAIEYGYTLKGDPAELAKISSRVAEAGLTYATDEDLQSSDPMVNQFDMGKDPLDYARARLDIAGATIRALPDKVVREGQGYQRARQAFDMLLYEVRRAGALAAKFVGGHSIHRDHKGDPNARPPIVPIPAAKQREALKLVCDRIFTGTAMQISPEALRYLAVGRWYHWGSTDPDQDPEYPIHDRILQVQLWTLFEILNPRTLGLVRDAEARMPEGDDALTTPELLSILTEAIWSEARADATGTFTNRKPYISTVRRNLQQEYTGQLIDLALEGDSGASPPCARTQAWQQLGGLAARIQSTLDAANQGKIVLDDYSRGHLVEAYTRIRKALEASYSRSAASGGGGGVIISIGSPAGQGQR